MFYFPTNVSALPVQCVLHECQQTHVTFSKTKEAGIAHAKDTSLNLIIN